MAACAFYAHRRASGTNAPCSIVEERAEELAAMVRGPTILVVDDEPASRIALRKIFAIAAYRFVNASTGAEALERIADHSCEMVVLDPALADMDGFELIRVIRYHSVMPIIVLSASDDEPSKVRAFDLGADDYVIKPFSDKELLARVRTAFRHRFQARGEQPRFVSGELEVDLIRRDVRVRRRPLTLTPLQYKAL